MSPHGLLRGLVPRAQARRAVSFSHVRWTDVAVTMEHPQRLGKYDIVQVLTAPFEPFEPSESSDHDDAAPMRA